MEDTINVTQAGQETSAVEGWAIQDLWKEYEKIAMHFNDLLIKLRMQALAAVAAISAVAGIFSKGGSIDEVRWGLAAAVFFFLSLFWVAIWAIDFLYYNRLLHGAVKAILDLEKLSKDKTHTRYINISTEIELAVFGAGQKPDHEMRKRRRKLARGRWLFYIIVFLALLSGLVFSVARLRFG